MPGANLGPELEVVDGDLTNPAGLTDLDKATAALSNLTAAVEDLKARLDKGEEASTTDVEQAAADAEAAADALGDKDKTAAALKDISDKAAELAKGTDLEGDALKEKVAELVAALQALSTPAAPAEGEVDAEKNEGTLGKVLATIAESALSLASKLDTNGVISTEDISSIDEVMDGIAKVATELAVEKLEEGIEIPLVFDDPQLDGVAKGMASVLRDVAKSAATLSPLAAGELGDASKQELGRAMGMMHLAKAKISKSADAKEGSFASTLREVAERALFLARKAERVEDEAIKKEAGQLRDLMQGLIEKYAAKTDGFDFADYSIVIDVDKKLNGIEAAVKKTEEPPAGDPPKPDEVKPDEAAAEGDKPAEGEGDKPAEGDKPEDTAKGDEMTVTKAMQEIEGLTTKVAELKSFIAKARDTVASPASGSEPEEGGDAGDDGPLFPMDFNDPYPHAEDDDEE